MSKKNILDNIIQELQPLIPSKTTLRIMNGKNGSASYSLIEESVLYFDDDTQDQEGIAGNNSIDEYPTYTLNFVKNTKYDRYKLSAKQMALSTSETKLFDYLKTVDSILLTLLENYDEMLISKEGVNLSRVNIYKNEKNKIFSFIAPPTKKVKL